MKRNQGITLVEALVGIAIISMILVFVMYTQNLYFGVAETALQTTKATYLAEEGQEFLRYLRDEDWGQLDSLTTGTTYYFTVSGGAIDITTTPEVVDGVYSRSFTLAPLNRSVSGDFVTTGGTSDGESRIATVTVSGGEASVSLTTIMANIHNI